MKPASPELRALLATRQFFVADLYTFTLVGGGVLRYCGGDQDLTANGFYYPAGGQSGPYFDRKDNKAKFHQKIGVEVDTLVFDVLPGSATVLGEPFLQAVYDGQFDGAEVTIERAYMPTYGDTRRGVLRTFVGRVAEVDYGRSLATFTINSHLELLNINLPRNLWQTNCVNNLGDTACGVLLSSYATPSTAASGSSAALIYASGITESFVGYWIYGKIVFTSGVLAGLSRSIAGADFGGSPPAFFLLTPFPDAPATGDAFDIYPGCDKTLGANGCPKFNNVPRFKGFPFVPVPITAV